VVIVFSRDIIVDIPKLLEELENSTKTWVAIDTETTGLHLKADKPFLLTITFDNKSRAIDLQKVETPYIQEIFVKLAAFKYVVGHNVKFDLHMLANLGIRYEGKNLTDTMILARLALDTDEVFSLALKTLATKYIDGAAGDDQKVIKSALMRLNKADKSREHTYLDVYNLPEYRQAMVDYALNDTEITIQLAKNLYEVMLTRSQFDTFTLENANILPLFRMERVGLNIDRAYLKDRKTFFDEYLTKKRKELHTLTGENFSVGQHKNIKEWFKKNGLELASSDDSAMEYVIKNADGDVKSVAKLIQELRSLEKWYSVYIVRMLEKSEFDGRAYTQINSNSAITGRLSSDFQQFPKYGLYDEEGNELFHPRKMVVPTGNKYNKIAFLDYSQIELRVQANYTYQISGGDLNMCRAYMPHKCVDASKVEFDPKLHAKDIFTKDWFTIEDGSKWKPVDLHSATTKEAFPDVPEGTDEFKRLRGLGKATNFAKNYGATKNALMEQFGFEESVANKLDKAYYQAFPKILDYQTLVRRIYYQRGYVKNMYGRRYYMRDKRFVYRLYNYLVQGSCADMLKSKIIDVDNLLTPYKSRFQMNIHDEMSFEIYDGEEFLIEKIKAIMEQVPQMIVPVVAEVEIATKNWAEKE
jgi:DNA polymerase-1